MAGRRLAGTLDDVFPAPEQLHDAEREIGKMRGILGASANQPLLERDGVWRRGQAMAALRGEVDDARPLGGHAHDAPQR